jgi:hypothetical protein
MKNRVLHFFILFIVFGCNDDHEPLVKTGSFNIAFKANDISGGRGLSLSDASSIYITIEDSEKNIIVDKKISLIKLNDDYLTESIPLNEGNYTLKRFLVLDEKDNAIYGTPVQGSRVAHLVDKALPISFAISPDQATSLPLEIISLKSHTAKDIGYTSFQVVYKCPLSVAVDDHLLCYDGSRYHIAYASVAGAPSFFSLTTSRTRNRNNGYNQIFVETTEFRGPGTYTIRKYDGGSERSTYGYFFSVDINNKTLSEYHSVSGTLVVESVKHIEGTTNGLAKGTFTMKAEDDQGNVVNIEGSFNGLLGMGWWE